MHPIPPEDAIKILLVFLAFFSCPIWLPFIFAVIAHICGFLKQYSKTQITYTGTTIIMVIILLACLKDMLCN